MKFATRLRYEYAQVAVDLFFAYLRISFKATVCFGTLPSFVS